MSDGEAIMGGILADPSDDVARLAYADWCEDSGQPERAEFIRVQLRLGEHGRAMARAEETGAAWVKGMLLFSARQPLLGRERKLILENWLDWTPRLSLVPDRHFEVILSAKWAFGGTPAVEFRRGFVGRVVCTLDAWLEHGPAIVRAHPVTRVELGGKEPVAAGAGYGWMPVLLSHDRGQLPWELADLLPGKDSHWVAGGILIYRCGDTSELAIDALSDALIAWARAAPPA